MTGRTGTQWVIDNNVTQTFTNDRQDFVVSDADGRQMAAGVSGFDDPWVISDTYQYDATGRMAVIEQWGDPPPNALDPDPPERRLQKLESGRDGDGFEVKETVVNFSETGQPESSLNKYYIRSSVLGGQVVTDLWGDGRKTRSFIRASGIVLAWQVMRIQAGGPDVAEVWWQYQDPGGTTAQARDQSGAWDSWKTSYSGSSMTKAELDPMGTDVGWNYGAVLPPPPPPSTGNFGGGFGWPDPEGDPELPDGRRLTCVVDGHRTPCANAWNVLRGMGIGVEAIKIEGPFAPHLSSHFPVTENRRWVRGAQTSHVRSRISGEDWSEGEITAGQPGHFETTGFETSGVEMLDSESCSGLVRFNLRDESRDGAPTRFPFINSRVARDFDAALQEINRAFPGGIGFNEVFRPSEHQQNLYNAAQKAQEAWNALPWYSRIFRTPPLPAYPPGTSAHEAGFAIDIPVRYLVGTVLVIFEKYGFRRDVPNDPPHLQWMGWNRLSLEEQKKAIGEAQKEYYRCHQ